MEIWVVLSVHKANQRLWNSTKCFNQIAFLFSSNLIHKLLSFWIFFSFHFHLFFRTFLSSFVFDFLSFFLSTNKTKIKQLLQTFLFWTIIKSQASRIRSHYQSLVNIMKWVVIFWSGGMNVCDVGEQRKANYVKSTLWLIQSQVNLVTHSQKGPKSTNSILNIMRSLIDYSLFLFSQGFYPSTIY